MDSLIIHLPAHQSFICLFIHPVCLYLFPCFGGHSCGSSPALIFPVSVAAAQQRPSDITVPVTWLSGCPSQRSLRSRSNGVELSVPSLGASVHGRLRPSGPWVNGRGGGRGMEGAKQGIAVLDMPHSCLKTAFLGLQGGRGYKRLPASRPGCEA